MSSGCPPAPPVKGRSTLESHVYARKTFAAMRSGNIVQYLRAGHHHFQRSVAGNAVEMSHQSSVGMKPDMGITTGLGPGANGFFGSVLRTIGLNKKLQSPKARGPLSSHREC